MPTKLPPTHKQVHLELRRVLIEKVDAAAKRRGLTRTAFVRHALARAVQDYVQDVNDRVGNS